MIEQLFAGTHIVPSSAKPASSKHSLNTYPYILYLEKLILTTGAYVHFETAFSTRGFTLKLY